MSEEKEKEKKLVGFARLSPEERRKIASKGGKGVPAFKRGFFNRDTASKAGIKGGKSVNPENRSFSKNRALASEAGRKGGKRTQSKKEGRNDEQMD